LSGGSGYARHGKQLTDLFETGWNLPDNAFFLFVSFDYSICHLRIRYIDPGFVKGCFTSFTVLRDTVQ